MKEDPCYRQFSREVKLTSWSVSLLQVSMNCSRAAARFCIELLLLVLLPSYVAARALVSSCSRATAETCG